MSEELLNALLSQATPLDDGQLQLLIDMAAALEGEIESELDPESDIVCGPFESNFSNRLRLHHATNAQKFNKKAFEYAFHAASHASGRASRIVSNPNNPGADVEVDGTNYSLKTEAAASISPTRVTISKLMEARWIRDLTSPEDCVTAMRDRVLVHLSAYSRILTLRAFDVPGPAVRYELWEIPTMLLGQIAGLVATDFSGPDEKSGSCRATVMVDGDAAFSIVLDGSVEKVTIRGLATDHCYRHAWWHVPSASSAD